MRVAAFLRGINLGSKNRASKQQLVEAFKSAGISDPVPYLQSGNVVFEPPAVENLENKIAEGLLKMTGAGTNIVLRSSDEIERILSLCPYSEPERGQFPMVHIIMSKHPFDLQRLGDMPRYESIEERHIVSNTEIYLYLPMGVSKSKLPSYILKRYPAATMRNWNTLNQVFRLMRDLPG